MKCILCTSNSVQHKGSLNVNQLKQLYHIKFGFDISNELYEEKQIQYYNCKQCNLLFFDPKFAGSSTFYEQLQKNRKVYYNPDRDEFEYAKSFIAKSNSVLEIGSGNGYFANKLATKDYVGLEYNDEAIENAKKNGVTLIKQSVEDFVKNQSKTYDIVCSFHVLEHVTNPFEFIKSSIDLLKPNGLLIISVPNNDSKLTNNLNHVLNMPPHHISRWNIASLKKIQELFDVQLKTYKVHFIGNKIPQKDYFLARIMSLLLGGNNRVLINPKRYDAMYRFINKIICKTKLYKLQSKQGVVGENITVVFKKTK